jgi:DNA-binding transcriptional LysR family regulator
LHHEHKSKHRPPERNGRLRQGGGDGSFSEAARQLGATPSATSRAVARLEKALGTQLLQRTTRKLRLSDSGEEIHARCRDMLNAAQAVLPPPAPSMPNRKGR